MNSAPKIAVSIQLQALAGKENELLKLLIGAADVVKETEPQTLYWFATRVSHSHFTIHDGFADETGLQAHFKGKVAGILKSKADELVVGGWENGVLHGLVRSDILSTIR